MRTGHRRAGRGARGLAIAAAALVVGGSWSAATAASAPAAVASAVAKPGTAAWTDAVRPATPVPVSTFRHDLDAVAAAGGIGVVAATSGQTLAWSGAAGVRTIDAAAPARAGDTARIGSVTKSMISVLVLQEVQAHRWTLQTRVGDVLPGLLPGHEGVTLEQLLSHRSGLPDYFAPLLSGTTTGTELVQLLRTQYTKGQLVRTALGQPWLFAPGTAFSYSNTNYVVLGMMLQKVNGAAVATLLRQRVFGPAHMATARLQTSDPWTTPKHLSDYGVLERPYNLDATSATVLSTAGAVEASPQDVDNFYRALFTGRLLAPWLVRQMVTPRTTTPLAYGLGIYAVGDPCPGPHGEQQVLYGHDGATLGTETLSFASADGTRQSSISWTGRDLDGASTTAQLANQFLIDAFTAGCPRAVPPASTGAAGELPSLGSLAPLDRARLLP